MRKGTMRGFVFLAVFLLCGAFLFADPFTMISAGSPLLEDLRAVVRAGGKSFLSLTPPLSRDEVLAVIDEIDPDSLSDPIRARYDRILDNLYPELIYSGELFQAAVHLRAALEGRYRSNKDISWLNKDNTGAAVLALPVNLFFADRVQLFLEPAAAADPFYYNHPVSSLGTNVPWEAERFDLNVPLRAFAASGGEWWNFQLGRDKVSFGPGRTGNLALSDNPDYYDFARLSFFSDVFKYSIFVSQMPMTLNHNLMTDSTVPGWNTYLFDTTNRYFYLHRLDIRLFQKFSIGLSEGVMVGNSPLELRYLNPVMVFHSFFSWKDYPEWGTKGDMNGSLFSLDLEWAFLPGWALYGQIAMNEFSTPYESNRFPDQPPPGMGYLLGAEYVHTLADWTLSWYAEAVYTDPFLYTLSSPFASMIWMRRSSDLGNKTLRYDWFGHREGRDMFLAALGVSAAWEKIACKLDFSFKRQGEHGMAWDWDTKYNNQKSPSGNPETSAKVLLGIDYEVLPSLVFSGTLGGTAVFASNHVKGANEYGIEAGLGVSYYY